MAKQVIITCTKPAQSVIEYGIRDGVKPDGSANWIRSGEVVTINPNALSGSDKAKVLNTRAFLLQASKDEARRRKASETVTVVTTHPEEDICIYSEDGREEEPPTIVTTTFKDLDTHGKNTVTDIKTLFTAIATADATTKGYLP